MTRGGINGVYFVSAPRVIVCIDDVTMTPACTNPGGFINGTTGQCSNTSSRIEMWRCNVFITIIRLVENVDVP